MAFAVSEKVFVFAISFNCANLGHEYDTSIDNDCV
jgi:hypothetical protein